MSKVTKPKLNATGDHARALIIARVRDAMQEPVSKKRPKTEVPQVCIQYLSGDQSHDINHKASNGRCICTLVKDSKAILEGTLTPKFLQALTGLDFLVKDFFNHLWALSPEATACLQGIFALLLGASWYGFDEKLVECEEFEFSAAIWLFALGSKGLVQGWSADLKNLDILLRAQQGYVRTRVFTDEKKQELVKTVREFRRWGRVTANEAYDLGDRVVGETSDGEVMDETPATTSD